LGEPPQVSSYLGIPEKTLAEWRWQGKGPRYVRVGRHVRYRWSDVEAWLETQARP
jgi:excisionase family DNA binding protein